MPSRCLARRPIVRQLRLGSGVFLIALALLAAGDTAQAFSVQKGAGGAEWVLPCGLFVAVIDLQAVEVGRTYGPVDLLAQVVSGSDHVVGFFSVANPHVHYGRSRSFEPMDAVTVRAYDRPGDRRLFDVVFMLYRAPVVFSGRVAFGSSQAGFPFAAPFERLAAVRSLRLPRS
jgi:hypothetical protein